MNQINQRKLIAEPERMVEQSQDDELQQAANRGWLLLLSYIGILIAALAYAAADVIGVL